MGLWRDQDSSSQPASPCWSFESIYETSLHLQTSDGGGCSLRQTVALLYSSVFCFFRNVSLLFFSILTQHRQFELVDVESETT